MRPLLSIWETAFVVDFILCDNCVAGAQRSTWVGSSFCYVGLEDWTQVIIKHIYLLSHLHSTLGRKNCCWFSFLSLDNFLVRKTEWYFKLNLSSFCNPTDFSLVNKSNARHTVYLNFTTVLCRGPTYGEELTHCGRAGTKTTSTLQHSCLSNCQSVTLSAGLWLMGTIPRTPYLSGSFPSS